MTVAAPDVNYWYDRKCAKAFWCQRELPPYKELLADTAAWLDPAPGEHWLDLGCGSGQLTRALWRKSEGAVGRVVSLDCAAANEESIAKVRAETGADAERLGFRHLDFSAGLGLFADNAFDGAVSGLAIQYAQHFSEAEGRWTTKAYDALLAEVCRVLKPGGRFVFSVNVPNPGWLRVAFHGMPAFFTSGKPLRFAKNSLRMMRYGSWLKREARRGRFHYLPAETIAEKLKAAGFVEVEHRLSFAKQAFIFRGRKPA